MNVSSWVLCVHLCVLVNVSSGQCIFLFFNANFGHFTAICYNFFVVFSISFEFNRNYGTVFCNVVTPFLYNKLSTVSTSCFWNVFWKPPWIATRSRHRYLGIIIIKVSKCYLHTVFTDFFRSHKCGIVAEILARSKQWLKTQRIIANNVEWCFVWHACPHLSGMTGTSSGYCWLESLGATPLQLPPTLWRHQ